MARTCSKVRAARAARLFSLARPINFLICGVVVAVPVTDAKAPYLANTTGRTARTSSKNVTSRFRNHFSINQSHYACKMCCNYPGIKLEPAVRDKTKERFSIAFTANDKRQAEISLLPKTREIYLVSAYILPVIHRYGASTKNR